MLFYAKRIISFLFSPAFLFCIGLFILILYALRTESNFLSINRVFKDYKSIFSQAKKHLLIFWGIPALFAIALTQISTLSETVSESILVFLSILIAAYFSLLSILVSQQGFQNVCENYKRVLKESASIVLLEIILCIFAIIITLATMILESGIPAWLMQIISFTDYYLIFIMLLNTLILIKRIKALIDNTN